MQLLLFSCTKTKNTSKKEKGCGGLNVYISNAQQTPDAPSATS